jgi:hypothetical protein
MSDTTKQEGFEAGQKGESADSNPHDNSGVLGRMFDITADVASANAGNITQTNDQNSSDWQEGHAAGSADREENK